MVDEDDGGAHEAVLGDVAVGLVEVLEEADGVAEFDPGAEGVEGQRVAEAGDWFDDALHGLMLSMEAGVREVVGILCGDGVEDDLVDFFDGVVFVDGDDAVGFAGGDFLIGGVDAAVEVVGFALEAVFVGAGGFDAA